MKKNILGLIIVSLLSTNLSFAQTSCEKVHQQQNALKDDKVELKKEIEANTAISDAISNKSYVVDGAIAGISLGSAATLAGSWLWWSRLAETIEHKTPVALKIGTISAAVVAVGSIIVIKVESDQILDLQKELDKQTTEAKSRQGRVDTKLARLNALLAAHPECK